MGRVGQSAVMRDACARYLLRWLVPSAIHHVDELPAMRARVGEYSTGLVGCGYDDALLALLCAYPILIILILVGIDIASFAVLCMW